MSDETENEAQEGSAGGKGTSLVVLLIAVILSLAAGAGGAYFALHRASEPGVAVPPEEAEAEPVDRGAEFKERLLALEPFVVNIGGDGYARFLKLKIELEADSPETRQELEARRPQVRDTTILLLSSKRLADIGEFEGKALLKDDIRERIDSILVDGHVESVLFTEFVVQ